MLSQANLIHVTTREAWERSVPTGRYYPDGFETEAFIHCSHRDQLDGVLSAHFSAHDHVLLLVLDVAKIGADTRYERSGDEQDYPHIYGPIEAAAVVQRIAVQRVDGIHDPDVLVVG